MLLHGLVALACVAPACRDLVHVHNRPAGVEYGVMYDGRTFLGSSYQDSPHRAFLVPQNISAVRFRSDLDTVVAFAPERAPVFKHVQWSWKIDEVELRLAPSVAVPVTFYPVDELTWTTVLYTIPGTPCIPVTLRDQVQIWIDSTNDLFSAERFGIHVTRTDGSPVSIPSGTADDSYSHAQALTPVAHEPKTLNVYLMKEVFSTNHAGFWTKDGNDSPPPYRPAILLGYLAAEVLLGHEIGHGLGLAHTDGCPCFDNGDDGETNLMDKDSGYKRRYVTEGQTLRAHFGGDSFLHDADLPELHFRSGIDSYTFSPKRSGSAPRFGDYPPTSWRIWPDRPEPASTRWGGSPECRHGTDGAAVDAAIAIYECRDVVFGQSGDVTAGAYLRLACRVGDTTDADRVLGRFADARPDRRETLEADFFAALEHGFDSRATEQLRTRARSRDARRTRWILNSALSLARPAEEQERSRRWTGDAYVEAVVTSAKLARQSSAMRGLVAIRSRAGVQRVRQLLDSRTPVLATAARSALLLLDQ